MKIGERYTSYLVSYLGTTCVGGCQIDFDLHHHFLRAARDIIRKLDDGARNVKSRKLDPIFAAAAAAARGELA